jgi:hypothetical protein
MSKTVSVTGIVLSGLYPLIGVIFLGWNIQTILFLYWLENIVAGFWNILKMRRAELPISNKDFVIPNNREYSIREENMMVITTFIFHFGIFTFGHGVFLKFAFLEGFDLTLSMIPAILATYASYGLDYYSNYIKKKEYKLVSSVEQMKEPYVRIIIMHLTIILGSFLIVKEGNTNIWPLIVLVMLKVVIDLAAYTLQDKKWLSKNISFS